MGLFGSKSGGNAAHGEPVRVPRHSSGWQKLGAHLRTERSLRILDIGPTSAGNINFITNLGHSIYMANLVEDAARGDYSSKDEAGNVSFDGERFVKDHMDFAGRNFDVVMLWDTTDYLPAELIQPVVDRLYDVLEPEGQLLAFFHSKATGDDTIFTRYHLTDTDQVQMQRVGVHPLLHASTNRQVEQMFARYTAYKFFLAKDALREVIVTR